MQKTGTILVLSDIHYACAAEQARGHTEYAVIRNPWLRLATRGFRHFIWLRDPHAHNHLLDLFLAQAGTPDYVIANGDYSCDSAFVGVSDEATCQSARECLIQLRQRFGASFYATLGDHELGKMSLFGHVGGLQLASWYRAQTDLGLRPFWQVTWGRYSLMGIVSSLVALPVYAPEALPLELPEWGQLRAGHLAEIVQAFSALRPEQRVLLFCHDPSALPFLWGQDAIRAKLGQVELTVIGHLHSRLILWKSRLLAGMPTITFLGNSIRRMSAALHHARHWRQFNVRLCPALTGIELLRNPGFSALYLDAQAQQPARFAQHRLSGKCARAASC
jgi:hypothetical protein